MKAFVAAWKRFFIWMNTVAEGALFVMMMLTVIDVILRRFFGSPVVGTYDLVTMMGAVVVGFSVPWTSWGRGHVFVDILIENRSKAVKNSFFIVTRIVGIVLFALLSYNLTKKGIFFYHSHETSMTLRVPVYPITFALAFCFFVQCFSLITDIFRTFDIGDRYE
jgi:TRAP-type C4-dicarboxylate transport system permease small subunit